MLLPTRTVSVQSIYYVGASDAEATECVSQSGVIRVIFD